MSEQDRGEVESAADIDLSVAFGDVRGRIAQLGDTITALRTEADRLVASADARSALAAFEPTTENNAFEELDASVELLGRHAADVPEEFDPRPFDDAAQDLATHASGPFDSLAAAPAFGDHREDDPSLPPLDLASGRGALDEIEPRTILGDSDVGDYGDEENFDPADQGEGATVLEFTPRATSPIDADASAFGLDDESSEQPVQPTPPWPATSPVGESEPDVSDEERDSEPEPREAEPVVAADGLEAIAATESTDVPADWDGPGGDEEAFDKFFSNDVEPEPAQRWLLNE